ncbi:hypothetical protein B0T22DRAFT_444997 [Podospora appendiculata]|uniref:Uncharacterized protein n=1 Tax=Podospora appendiculata TaxID=314037 RepID=A0AAE1C8J6_9PEZI|nr:hypothetical protein B0T22DRAFT_444997 [Podospora appendiculata]
MMKSQASLRCRVATAHGASDIDIDTKNLNPTATPTNGNMNPAATVPTPDLDAEGHITINTTSTTTTTTTSPTPTPTPVPDACDLGTLCGNPQVLRHIRMPRAGNFCAPCRRTLLAHLRDAAAATHTPLTYGEKLDIALAQASDVAAVTKMGAECAFDIGRELGAVVCIAAVDHQKKMLKETVLPATKVAARSAGLGLRTAGQLLGSGVRGIYKGIVPGLKGLRMLEGKTRKKGEGRYLLAEGSAEDDGQGEEEAEEGGFGYGDDQGHDGGFGDYSDDSGDEVEWQLVENPHDRSARNGAEV